MFLDGIIEYVTHEGATAVGLTFGAFIAYITRRGYDYIKEWKRKKHAGVIPKLVEKDVTVYKILSELLIETLANRAFVVQFHNGVYYINQANQMKMSCTHEIVQDGISREQGNLQEVLLSRFPNALADIIGGSSAVFDVQENDKRYFYQVLKSQGVDKCIASVMKDGNIVEGFVAISYVQSENALLRLKDEEAKQKVEDASARIGFLLRN